jgi:hypothetical protein
MILLLVASALACDQAIFSAIPAPPLGEDGRGVDTGEYTLGSTKMVGARLVRTSAHTVAQWQPVLKQGDKQDEWMPAQFGYEDATLLDSTHMYLRFDIGFLLDAVRVKRQLVVQLQEAYRGNSYRSCWMMVDPTPYMSKLQGLVADVAWEKSSQGWWEVSPRPEGGSLVTYQWWTEASAIPSGIMRYGMSRTLPDLMDAFEVRVGQVAGK